METSVESQNLLSGNDDCVRVVDLRDDQEATTENFMEGNTQHVLEVHDAMKIRKKAAKGKTQVSVQKKLIQSNPLIKWLENFWQSEATLRVMKPFLKNVNDAALKERNMPLYSTGQIIQKIMKEFFIHMKTQNKDLTNCGFSTFEEWFLNEGLSTTYGKLQSINWVPDLEKTLFDHYSTVLIELEERERKAMEDQEEENTTSVEHLSLPNMKSTFTSSMIAHTPGPRVVASTSKDFEIMSPIQASLKKSKDGHKAKSVTFLKEKSVCSKRKTLDVNVDSEEEMENYNPGEMFRKTKKTVEEESEPEVEMEIPQKKKKARRQSTDSDNSLDATPNDEDFTSMVANHARAHSLVMSTGKISQTILIKEDDGYINISSPGERGSMLIKLELYPFKDCVKLNKNQYWTKRTFSCMGMSSGEDSRVHKLAMKLRYELTKQVMNLKNVKVEKKVQTGWKGF